MFKFLSSINYFLAIFFRIKPPEQTNRSDQNIPQIPGLPPGLIPPGPPPGLPPPPSPEYDTEESAAVSELFLSNSKYKFPNGKYSTRD